MEYMLLQLSKLKKIICIIVLFVMSSCASNYDIIYTEAVELKNAEHYKDAYKKFSSLCKSKKGSPACDEKEILGDHIVTEGLKVVINAMEVASIEGYIPLHSVQGLKNDTLKLLGFGYDEEVNDFALEIDEAELVTRGYIEEVMDEVSSLIEENEIVEAFDYYDGVVRLDNSQEAKFHQRKSEVVSLLMDSAELAGIGNDWNKAHSLYLELNGLAPETSGISSLLVESEKKDSLIYYLEQAETLISEYNYEGALKLYEYAEIYEDPLSSEESILASLALTIRAKYIEDAFSNAFQFKKDGDLYKSYLAIEEARLLLREIPIKQRRNIKVPYNKILSFAGKFFNLGNSDENIYKAYAYLRASFTLNPLIEEPRLSFKDIEDEIYYNSIKNIFIDDFMSTEDNAESAMAITSGLSNKIFNSLYGDVVLVDRKGGLIKGGDVRPGLLVLPLSGKDTGNIEDNLKVTVDHIVSGDVINYGVKSLEDSHNKTVRVKTGEKKVPNPEYEKWLIDNKRALKKGKDVQGRPNPTLVQDVTEDITYEVRTVEKVATARVSFMVTQGDGRVFMSDEVMAVTRDSGESSDEVTIGVFHKPSVRADIKSDDELLSIVEGDVIFEIVSKFKEIFKDSGDKFEASGFEFLSKGDKNRALESFVKSLIIKEKKGKEKNHLLSAISEIIDGEASKSK